MTEWVEVLTVLVDGPRLPVRGIVRTRNAEALGRTETVGFIGSPPMWVGTGGDDVRVWRDGRRVRVERPDGSLLHLNDGTTAWTFGATGEPPEYAAAGRVYYGGPGSELVVSRDAQEWLRGDDFTRPAGPVSDVEFLGRPCWAVELGPPPHKPAPIQIVVDRESGAVVHQGNEQFDVSVEFISIEVGGELDDALFIWTGDAVSMDERRAAQARAERAEYEEAQAARLARIESELGALSFAMQVPVELTITDVDELGDDGDFSVRIRCDAAPDAAGYLRRRPHEPERWHLDNTGRPVHHWTAAGFDWALWFYGLAITPGVLEQVQQQLHPGESVSESFIEKR